MIFMSCCPSRRWFSTFWIQASWHRLGMPLRPAIARQVPVITANHKNCMMRKNGLSTCVCMCVVVFFSVFGWMYSWWVYACKQGHYVYDGVSKKAPERVGGDLEIPLTFRFSTSYGWWLKSCTTWDVRNPINNGILSYISTGWPDFWPSTVGFRIFLLPLKTKTAGTAGVGPRPFHMKIWPFGQRNIPYGLCITSWVPWKCWL